ncbi:MAG: efflux RND transporter periplasmic adaptor subunit [Halieaceae bacterium]|jgi:RND family efflux transporter MFP subunit|nr:efflux RND transporter periplasmic adaptor subunit [Halieaceae bacterium]
MNQPIKRAFAALLLMLTALPASAQQWYSVKAQTRPITVQASGLVTSQSILRFGPPPSKSWRTTITQLVAEGRRVEAGDLLARFDSSASDDRVRDLEGQLATARSELASFLETQARDIEQEKLDVAEAQSEAKKAAQKADQPAELLASLEYEKLVEEKRIAELRYQQATARLQLSARVREARQQELEADIRRLQIQYQAAKDELASFTILAPQPGLAIVGTDREGIKLDVNSSVNPGIVVVELVDDTQLQLQVEVPEHASAGISTGQPVRVFVDAAGSTELAGTVKGVANIVRRQSRNTQTMVRDVIVSLDNPSAGDLRPGMSVSVSIEVDRLENTLAIPQSALTYRGGAPGVHTRDSDWQPIRLGRRSGDDVIVTEGLEDGQEVLL